MIDRTDVERAVDSLIVIHRAGQLSTAEQLVNHETGAIGDLERWPTWEAEVDLLAGTAARMLDLPEEFCRDAVCQRLLPSTRRRIAVEIIQRFVITLQRIDEGYPT